MQVSVGSSHRWDRELLMAAAILAVMSAMVMASAAATARPGLAFRHDVWILIGVVVSIAVGLTNYRQWGEVATIAYGLSVVALALVLVAGTMRLGATRWLSLFGLSIQPSEVAKLTTAWLLARYLAGQPTPLPSRVMWRSLGIVAPPALLVFLQPDLGTASVFGAIWLGMVWVAGASRRSLTALIGGLLALLPIGWHVLKDYQRTRLLMFLNPHADPLGAGFSIIQSTIAIGSGQLFGRGWFAGPQNRLSFLPEHHSDFIFAVIGEEWGFLGSVGVICIFGWVLMRAARIALETSDPQGRLLATGIFSWLAYQTFVNLGMVMGVLPVVGVPLPLVSYGGSSMVTIWAALGLLQSVHRMDRQ